MVVIDTTMLLLLLSPEAAPPQGPDGKPVRHAKARVEHLVSEIERTGRRVAIPTPALSEALVRRGISKSQQLVQAISEQSVFSIEPFEARAAIEMAELMRTETAEERKQAKRGGAVTHAKLKFDRQIVAIAKTIGAKTIYTDDGDLRSLCARHGITPIGIAELPLPAELQQHSLPLEGNEA